MSTDQTLRYYRPDMDLSFKPVSEEEERALFQASQKGDKEAREKIVNNHLLFAANEARKMVRGRIADNEVVSAANLALMKAIDRFNWERGNRFTTYLRPFIRGEISALWKAQNLVADYNPADNKTAAAPVTPSVESHPFEEQDFKSFLRGALAQCRSALTTKEQETIEAIYDGEKNFADVARERKISREAVRTTHNRAIAKLRKAMLAHGINSSR